MDIERYLYITGRKKDLIILSNGKNVRPDIIEEKLKVEYDLVKDAAVTAVNNHLFAVIVPDMVEIKQQGISNVTEKIKFDVIDAYNKHCENYKKIYNFMITTDELPRTRMGKMQRYKLKEFIESNKNKDKKLTSDIPQSEEYEIISKYLSEVSGTTAGPDDHIEIDLGLDSLELVELQLYLKRSFGVTLHEDELPKYAVVRDLSSYIEENKTRIEDGEFDWKKVLTADIDWKMPTRLWMLKVFHLVFRAFFRKKLKLQGNGSEYVPDGPCIIAPNHTSYLDSIIVYNFLDKKHRDDLFFLAKEKNFRNTFLRTFAKNAHVVIMDINRDLLASLQKIAKLLKSGKKVMIFPEGTRTRDGNIQKFKNTFAQIAKTLNVPVVPVAIKGAFEAMPHTKKLPQEGEVKVHFLKPIDPEKLTEEEIVEQTRMEITESLKADVS